MKVWTLTATSRHGVSTWVYATEELAKPPPEPHQDIFGRDELKVWCRREDTGSEGWMTYGFGAGIELMNR